MVDILRAHGGKSLELVTCGCGAINNLAFDNNDIKRSFGAVGSCQGEEPKLFKTKFV